MVTKATFDRVQAVLHNHGNPRPQTPKVFTYRGFLVCGECGRAITAEEKKGHVCYRCTKSGGGAKTCSQRYLREETLETQLAAQLGKIAIPERVYGLLRRAVQDSHAQEKQFRDTAIASLRRRQDEVQKNLDILLDRLLDETISQEVFSAKNAALQNEKAEILAELEAHERANERFFDEAEILLLFARRLPEIFANGDSDRKKALLKVVASNGVLSDGKAHLNLRPAFVAPGRRVNGYSWLRG